MGTRLSYLRRIAGRYHFRIRVPVDVVPVAGHAEFYRALWTADPRVAGRCALKLAAAAGRVFDRIWNDDPSPE